MDVDFGKTSADYARHRRGFPGELSSAARERGVGAPGARLLDLGCGTGALALEFARGGARVIAADLAQAQLVALGDRARSEGLALGTLRAAAEAVPLAAASCDSINIGQAWHWFEPTRASAELRRLLAPGGRVLCASYDWLPLSGSVVERTERLILEHNPAWTMAGLDGRHPEWERDLGGAGFEILEVVYEDLPATYSHEDWRGRIRASAGVAASLPPRQVARFDDELAELLRSEFPDDPLEVPHRLGFCLARPLPR